MDRTTRRHAGFSLTELMIAVAILVVVTVAVMQSFVVQNKAYTVTDQVIEAQQGLRAVAWLLERDARTTGFLVPEAAAVCAIDATNGPDALWFTDADALDPAGATRPALGADVTGGYSTGAGPKTLTVNDVVLDDAGAFYADTAADFQDGGGAILVDADDPAGGVACGVVLSVSAGSVRVDFENSLAGVGTRLVLVPAHVYRIDTAAAEPQLLRNGRAIATGVEDLQIELFFDQDRDGVVDDPAVPDGELPGALGADAYEADAYDNRDLREIRIHLVTRTRQEDAEVSFGEFQARGNRVAPGGNDGYRRRVHTSTVKLRNVGYRGTAT